ncbi:hypothetical protein I553_1295 [Mycobacterium xenopi 4042]|uniref:Uncharacterized protein n=1 Tax=Mycobacterium xenopi 4042 TaxID=1299334 RepID=X8CG94_MYCXE|nr:hypothetical protein I553_1295 [Mycobacterium xenopi 4042]
MRRICRSSQIPILTKRRQRIVVLRAHRGTVHTRHPHPGGREQTRL